METAMELYEYPRPANDTGIGVHWSPGYASAVGLSKIRDFWLPELKAMGVKWVKIYNHDSASEWAELLLDEGLMPIVRIYRATPNPGRLSVKDLVQVDSLIRLGVRYFEFNSEPDRDAEWKGGRVPANAIDIVVEDSLADMEAILERGGMPAIPAVSTGSRWDLLGKMIEKGRRDLFDGPVWQAIHNYCHNRPLDYPYDVGNQEGAAFTDRFYRTLRNEHWGGDPWQGRALAEINRLRLNHCNPGATVMDDHACWLAYEFFDARIRRHLGRSLPILSTEGGYVVGECLDLRYPATTPDLHLAQTLEACRVMMGTSQRFKAAIDAYFCTAFTLIANHRLGNSSDWWETYAWYSSQWPGGALPIVKALRAEPKTARRWHSRRQHNKRITLYGTVRHAGDYRHLILDQHGEERARADIDAHGRYRIPDLPPGSYTLRVSNTSFVEAVTLNADQHETVLNLDLASLTQDTGKSIVRAHIRGGAGAVVILLRTDDGSEWIGMARDDGFVRFVDLPPGRYSAHVQPDGQRSGTITLDGKNEVDVELAVRGWGYTIRAEVPAPPSTDGAVGLSMHMIRCSVEGHRDMVVRARRGEWESKAVRTGSAYKYGPYACEIVLPSNQAQTENDYIVTDYTVVVEGVTDDNGQPVPLEAQVPTLGRAVPMVEFVYTDLGEQTISHNSAIIGRVVGGGAWENDLQVALYDSQGHASEQPVDAEGGFRFTHLGPGTYSVLVVGHETTAYHTDIGLDGRNQVTVELAIPVSADFGPVVTDAESAAYAEPEALMGNSTIAGLAPSAVGQVARLSDSVGNEYTTLVGSDERFRFDLLPAGIYTLTVQGGYEQEELAVDGENGIEVYLGPLESRWVAEVSAAGSMPGFSAVRVDVAGYSDLPVYLFDADDEEAEPRVMTTGSRPDLGEFALEFSPLSPGSYFVAPAQLDIRADVSLTGLEAIWVNFHQVLVPSSPNVIVPLGTALPAISDQDMSTETVSGEQERKTQQEPPTTASSAPSSPAAPALSTYLFIGKGFSVDGLTDNQELSRMLRFITEARPTIGSDVGAASQAGSIIVIGTIDGDVLDALRARGARVELAYDDLIGALDRFSQS